ncbi:MAG: NADH-quinone oxidoreductase subunit J [Fidelibacterota bacterium]
MMILGFWFVVLLTVLSAFFVVTSRNLVYSAVSLFFTFVGVAGLYIFLWADFLAGVQIMVYVGGVLVLILFGIMLTHRITSVNISHGSRQRSPAALVTMIIIAGLAWVVRHTPWYWASSVEPDSTARAVGTSIMTEYLLPFEVASILLLAALVGAAVLSRRQS